MVCCSFARLSPRGDLDSHCGNDIRNANGIVRCDEGHVAAQCDYPSLYRWYQLSYGKLDTIFLVLANGKHIVNRI